MATFITLLVLAAFGGGLYLEYRFAPVACAIARFRKAVG